MFLGFQSPPAMFMLELIGKTFMSFIGEAFNFMDGIRIPLYIQTL